jgi:hypothetical protein
VLRQALLDAIAVQRDQRDAAGVMSQRARRAWAPPIALGRAWLTAGLDAVQGRRILVSAMLSMVCHRAWIGREAVELCAGLARRARCAGVYDKAVMHVPVESARPARELARSRGADCALAIGGGSTIGLAKAWRSIRACRSWRSPRPTRAPR